VTTIFCIQPKGFNVGNDAIHLALRHLIDEAFGRVVNIISVPATKRYESHNRAGLTPRTVYEINQYGDGVIVGGGNLYENGELDLDLDALDVLEVPLLLFSLSWGRVHNRSGRLVRRTDAMPDRIIAALDARADYSLTRDHATLEHLRSIGCAKAVFGGCPTVLLDRIVHLLPPVAAADRDLTLISVRTPELMSIAPERQARVHGQIEAIIAYLRGAGHEKIRLLCHDHRDISFATSFPGIEYGCCPAITATSRCASRSFPRVSSRGSCPRASMQCPMPSDPARSTSRRTSRPTRTRRMGTSSRNFAIAWITGASERSPR
jgi:hypothetical protein